MLASALPETATARQDCNEADARARFEMAMNGGAITAVSRFNGISTIHVSRGVWARMDFHSRLGMLGTFECVVAGRGNVLLTAQVVDEGGRVLATWDGRTRQMHVR
jgi:hypothetical protein